MMEEKILVKIRDLRAATGLHPKYIVLNLHTWYKLKHEVLEKYPYGQKFEASKEGAELRGVPILLKADSFKKENYIEIIPETNV